MIVDDEEFCLMGLKVVLESTGFDVTDKLDMCMSASEAIEKVHQAHKLDITHSLIITDIQMPEMDGIELTKHLRSLYRDEYSVCPELQPKIIGVSGHVQSYFIKQAIDAGMDQFQSKPLYSTKLRQIL